MTRLSAEFSAYIVMTRLSAHDHRGYTLNLVLDTPDKAVSPPRQRGIFVPHGLLHGEDAPVGNSGRPDFIQVSNILPTHPLETNS